jgi:asparagine synthase (glutamine-hydrolysing)
MCGISGIVNFSGAPVSSADISLMSRLVEHRGPDGEGIYKDENIALGHRRLSIIDLSTASSQPMHYMDKYVIVYNGEIYNYIEIKDELKKAGYSFVTNGDTEVILAAYDFWKNECVNHFNGMWSFCIYSIQEKKIFCSRDRFGVKPFYYSLNKDVFRFASEIKQLLPFFPEVKVNRRILSTYLVLGLEEYNDETFYKDIIRLLPGHNLELDLKNNRIHIKKYYSISVNPLISQLSVEESAAMLLSELKRSISYRLRSDVKVGSCLSGGLDSSVIVALASESYHKASQGKFTAITASSTEAANDESRYASMVASANQVDWITVRPAVTDFINSVDDVIKTQEEPFGSPSVFMQYFVMQKAKETGCTVLLDGQGGDETLLGYDRYYSSYLRTLPPAKRIMQLLNNTIGNRLPFKMIADYIYFTNPSVRLSRQRIRAGFLEKENFNFMNKDLIKTIASSFSDTRTMQMLELTTTQLPHLLRYEDKNSMRFSVETRLPFLDYKLVELSLSINDSYKIMNGYSKFILRKAAEKILPSEITWRKNKVGFESPTSTWMKDKKFMYDAISKSAIMSKLLKKGTFKTDNTMLWRLYNVARWEQIFNVTYD